jgi:hypothetical protein
MKHLKTFEALSAEDKYELRNTVSSNRQKVIDDYIKDHPLTMEETKETGFFHSDNKTFHLKRVNFDGFDSDNPSDFLQIYLHFVDEYRNEKWIGVQKDPAKKDNTMPKWGADSRLPSQVGNIDEILAWVDRFLIGRVSEKEKDIIMMYMSKELDQAKPKGSDN